MKILHVIDSGGFYGAEAMLLELALEQKKADHQVTICSIGTPNQAEKPIEKACRKHGVDVFPLRMKAGLNILGGMEIVRYAKHNQFDLFHSHGYKGNILLGILPKFVRRLPLVITLHGWTSTKGLTKMRLYEVLDSFLLSRMDAIVVVSEAMLHRKGISGRKLINLSVISNGISLNVPKAQEDDPVLVLIRNLKANGPLVGSIGRLSYEKGFDILLEGFRQVLDSYPNANLVIIGEGRLKNELESQARQLGIYDKVYFLGYLSGADKFIAEFDVYVNSSRTEGTPITLIECLRAGVNIVATNVGGNSAVLGDGIYGELVEECDGEHLSKAINNVLTIADSCLVKKRQLYFKDNFSAGKMASGYQKVYGSLIN